MDGDRIVERQANRDIGPYEERIAQFMLFGQSSHPAKLIQRNVPCHARIIWIVGQCQCNLPVLTSADHGNDERNGISGIRSFSTGIFCLLPREF